MINDIKFYGSATVGTKGQIVIPSNAREELNIKEGEKMIVIKVPNGEGIVVLKANALNVLVNKLQSQIGQINSTQRKSEGSQ